MAVAVAVTKIDRSFVIPLTEGGVADSSVVTAILQIGAGPQPAHGRRRCRDAGRLDMLRRMGCELVQGFVHHRP